MEFFSEGHGRGTKYYLPQAPIQSITGGITYVATSGSNVATSGSNMATSGGNMATLKKKRMSRKELHALIILNCEDWIAIDELSTKVERDSTYLRNHILPVLLASKKIEMLYPGTPNHPRQKYKKTY
jgi:hypothetical protein